MLLQSLIHHQLFSDYCDSAVPSFQLTTVESLGRQRQDKPRTLAEIASQLASRLHVIR